MTWEDTYKTFAENFSNAVESPPLAADYVYSSLLTLTSLTSNNFTSNNINDMLYPLNSLYLYVLKMPYNMESEIKKFIKIVNDFTVINYGDLATFVNSIDWHEGCIPFYWWTYSDDLGYDTSEWIGCSS